ncbi:hypothetical protein [Thioclava kandeliae]|uniref:Tetratricopeptide repeat protein n=1 Tax=Thioclava kandeliae TaxID=3070818 RepID=A0ABV1SNB1_9RHOB
MHADLNRKLKKEVKAMEVRVENNTLKLRLSKPSSPSFTLWSIDRVTSEKQACLIFTSQFDGETLELSTAIEKFNIASHRLIIETNDGPIDTEESFARFRLDLNQVDNHAYMTQNLFGAGIRSLPTDDLFYLCLCHLDILPHSNQFYGGLITLSAFRIAEDIENRSNFTDALLFNFYKAHEAQAPKPNHSVRWKLSSAVNLAILLCYLNRVNDAKAVVEKALSALPYNGIFPLTYMNYANLLVLSAIFSLRDEDRDAAYLKFAECANFCNSAVSDLFSLRNNFYFQHEQDVRTLIDVGYQAAAAMAALGTNRHPGDSKMTMNVEAANPQKISFNPVIGRFLSILKTQPSILKDIIQMLKS